MIFLLSAICFILRCLSMHEVWNLELDRCTYTQIHQLSKTHDVNRRLFCLLYKNKIDRAITFKHAASRSFSKILVKSKLTVRFANSFIVASLGSIEPTRTTVFVTFQSFVTHTRYIPWPTTGFVHLACASVTTTQTEHDSARADRFLTLFVITWRTAKSLTYSRYKSKKNQQCS